MYTLSTVCPLYINEKIIVNNAMARKKNDELNGQWNLPSIQT